MNLPRLGRFDARPTKGSNGDVANVTTPPVIYIYIYRIYTVSPRRNKIVMRRLEPFYLDRKTGSSLLQRSLKLSPIIRLEASTLCGVELHRESRVENSVCRVNKINRNKSCVCDTGWRGELIGGVEFVARLTR